MAVQFPRRWATLQVILKKLAYHVDSRDDWQTLGFAFMEGPSPTETSILNRARVGRLLCGLAHSAGWAPACRAAADIAAQRRAQAEAGCNEGLGELLKARRKQKHQLVAHKEFGPVALEELSRSSPPNELLLTQWSSILPSTVVDAASLQHTRSFAALAERGDARAWQAVAGRAVTFWVPDDPSHAARLLKAYLDLSVPEPRPQAVRMVAPIPLVSGATTVEQVLDLWHSPLLLSKWSSVVQGFTITTTPMSMVLPGRTGPRHVHMGLAIFHLSRSAMKMRPQLLEPSVPLLAVAAQRIALVDAPTEALPQLLALLKSPDFQNVTARDPVPSPLCVAGRHRMVTRLIFPSGMAEVEVLIRLSTLRGLDNGGDIFYGLQDMAGDKGSLILEIGNTANFRRYWTVCGQALVLPPKKKNSAVRSGAAGMDSYYGQRPWPRR